MSLIKRETDYALRIIKYLTNRDVVSVSEICEEQILSKAFSHKIIKKLEAAGMVKIVRGPGGGIALSCNLEDQSLFDIMEAVDNEQYINDCLKPGYQCEYKDCKGCKSNIKFSEWQEALNAHLKTIKLSTLM